MRPRLPVWPTTVNRVSWCEWNRQECQSITYNKRLFREETIRSEEWKFCRAHQTIRRSVFSLQHEIRKEVEFYVDTSQMYLLRLIGLYICLAINGTTGKRRHVSLMQASSQTNLFNDSIVISSEPIVLLYSSRIFSWYSGWEPRAYRTHDKLVARVSCPANMKVFTSSLMSSSERTVPSSEYFNSMSSRAKRLFDGSLKLPSCFNFHSAFLSLITWNSQPFKFPFQRYIPNDQKKHSIIKIHEKSNRVSYLIDETVNYVECFLMHFSQGRSVEYDIDWHPDIGKSRLDYRSHPVRQKLQLRKTSKIKILDNILPETFLIDVKKR